MISRRVSWVFLVSLLIVSAIFFIGRVDRIDVASVFSNHANRWSLRMAGDAYIRHCITEVVVGKVSGNLQTQTFSGPKQNNSEAADKRKTSFDHIFKSKTWIAENDKKNEEMASGPGSTLQFSQEVIAGLHTIIHQLKKDLGVSRIRMLDIPCGDMVWMRRFLRTRNDIDYTGMDIVSDLIARHKKNYGNLSWKFREQDVVQKPLNGSFDLILCRMMLQHLYNNDVLRVLQHLSESGSRFLLTTSFFKNGVNTELTQNSHRFRELNLELPPVGLVPPVCVLRDGEKGNVHGDFHFLGLWRLPLEKPTLCNATHSFKVPIFNGNFFSCTNWT